MNTFLILDFLAAVAKTKVAVAEHRVLVVTGHRLQIPNKWTDIVVCKTIELLTPREALLST